MKKTRRFWAALLSLVCISPVLSALPAYNDDDILREFLWQKFIELPTDKRPKIGLALSAGGVRGFAHVGTLEVLDNARVPIDMMSGTSMGSVVGSLYAAGLPTKRHWVITFFICQTLTFISQSGKFLPRTIGGYAI